MSQPTIQDWNYSSFKALCGDCGTDSQLLCFVKEGITYHLCFECRDKKEDLQGEDDD